MAKARNPVGLLARAHPESTERVVVLTCMDRQPGDEIERELIRNGRSGRYDHLILAGASLGAITSRFPHWGRMFYEHLALSRALHGMNRVVLVDHRNCLTYERLLGLGLEGDLDREREVHLGHLQRLRRKIHVLDPTLQVECWLMDATGAIENLSDADDLWLPGITERRRNPRALRKKSRVKRPPAKKSGRARSRR